MSTQPIRPEPFRIEPKFVERIWGMRSLAPLFPEKTSLREPIGEVWLTGVDCKVASGLFAGKTLGEVWKEMPAEWRGTHFNAGSDFPILIKFIFPNDKLSIQVHPDDVYAAVHEKTAGGHGKTEMWHVISAETDARVLIGLVPKASREKFVTAIETQTLEEIFVHWRVQPGDTFFVPAGTPHTIGPGMVLCEIQEYSDLTYRVYDYGRVDALGKPRELHIQKALDVIQFGRPVHGKVSRISLPSHESQRVLLSACPYFATERWKIMVPVEAASDPEHFELFIVLTGNGEFAWSGGSARFQYGECWLIPAGSGRFSLNPQCPTKLLRTYVPDIQKLRDGLKQKNHSWQEIEKTVFD
ncbi:MAG TPA: type I phosphomannose isomerase catalytic subunit [Candidatus Acidoferrum sp.]|nr:type I phosphomannose isomerase catalytic subunit [Candidatus Acidoferrum sp.]